MKKRLYCVLITLCVALYITSTSLFADTAEHPVIKPIPKSILDRSSEHNNYTYEFPFYDKKANTVSYKEITGRYGKWSYHIFGKDTHRVDGILISVEIIRNYKELAIRKGGNILWEKGDGSRLSFAIPNSKGDKIWCHVTARDGYYELDIVEKEIIEKKPNSIVKEMKTELDIEGKITVYSILFDFDRYNLKEQSEKPLQEIADLLLSYPDLKIEIQGHTDNQGRDDYNLKLSQRRATVVRSHLVSLGVDPSRLTAAGYGSFRPITTNKTREGRAKNRRVVLIEK